MEPAVAELIRLLKNEKGPIRNIKFCIGEKEGLSPADVAKQAAKSLSMHQNGLTSSSTEYSEPHLDGISLKHLFRDSD